MHAETIISVRYVSGTWLARAKGCKKTASCVYDAEKAAQALARKLGLDADHLVKKVDGRDYLEFSSTPSAAEQPYSTTSDKYRAELYDEVWDKARAMGFSNVTEALAELERIKAMTRHLLDSVFKADEEFKGELQRRLPAKWKMVPELPTIAMAEAGKRAMAAGGDADAVFAAMLEQAPCPEAWPQQGAQEVQLEALRKSDALWELESSIKDLARQVEGEYRARYYAGAVGFLRALHMMRVVDAEERNRWKVKILEAHLQAIAQCEAAGEVVPEEIKRREAFKLENLRRIERVTEALQGKEDV
ncbi:hypothetical protein [Pseudomonas sp. AN-1]|uniref:hypothetical protein n=1 Tax=Pseudomonas sp. AN-1 TaxID=3096605 RepID=UPI002A6A576D|nr:hypothetical protein [Pseudomonas sp. AN-1]WPP47730.1 hypothetical protein SK095_10350 [Pseudomonas sp. AN-1]